MSPVYQILTLLILYLSSAQQTLAKAIEPPLVIIYESDQNNYGLQVLKAQLTKQQYDFVVLGQGEHWNGLGQKLTGVYEYIKTIDPKRVIAFTDARDVLPMRPAQEFTQTVQKYIDTKKWATDTILIGREFFNSTGVHSQNYYYPGELFSNNQRAQDFSHIPWWRYPLRALNRISNISPRAYWIKHFKLDPKHPRAAESNRAFINSGWHLATAGTLRKILENIDTNASNLSDQHVINDVYYYHPEYFSFDDESALVYNCDPGLRKLPGH